MPGARGLEIFKVKNQSDSMEPEDRGPKGPKDSKVIKDSDNPNPQKAENSEVSQMN
jgi:hypothetical protein